jgi:hypothetical protein
MIVVFLNVDFEDLEDFRTKPVSFLTMPLHMTIFKHKLLIEN